MKKLKEIFNFKNKKSISIACLIALLITASTIGFLKYQLNTDFENFGTESGEGLNTEISQEYKKLSENLYKVNVESHTIYFEDSSVGMFCLSDSENGPTAQDKWIKANGAKEVEIDADSVNKKYVYYLDASIVNSNVGVIGDTDTNITTYIITTYEDFVEFRNLVNSGTTFEGKTVSLNKDISLAIEKGNYTPIGTSTNPFKGTFDGNGNTITDLIISNTSLDYAGLFGYVVDGTIKNLTISGTTGISGKNYVGTFVGNLSGTLENCINNTDVTGVGYAGGLVGVLTDGKIKYCINNNTVKTTDTSNGYNAGGIVSTITKGTIYNCVNYGDITAGCRNSAGIAGKIDGETTVKYCESFGTITSTTVVAGGIIGRIAEGVTVNAENCKNSGIIASTQGCAGGIIGDAAGNNTLTINNCINVASVTAGERHAGGIIGTSNVAETTLDERKSTSTTIITNCFNSGDIQSTSKDMVGGIIGSAWGNNTITYCGNTGNISVPISSTHSYAAGIAGMLVGTSNVTYCYNTGNIKGYQLVAGIACSPNKSEAKTNIEHCYSRGQMQADQTSTNAGIAVLYGSSGTLTYSNNYFYGSYVDEDGNAETSANGLYVKNKKNLGGDNVSDFSVYSDYFTQNNYGLLEDGDWLLKWQVPATLIRNPFDIYDKNGTMDVVTYGAESNFTYQWYNANSRTSNGTAISGATSSTLTLPVAGVTGDYYYCVVTSKDFSNNTITTKSESAFYGEKTTEKIEFEVPTISGTYTYSGTEQTLVLNGFDENYMSINQTKATDAGTIEIQISLNDTARYSWADKTTETKKLNWVIAKKQVIAVWGTLEAFTYDGKEHAPIVTAETGIANEELVIVRTTAINTGNHTSTATIEKVIGGTGNAKNYELLNASKSFTINSFLTDIAVSIQGKNEYDQLLTVKIDTEIPNLKYQYQWYSNTTNSTIGGTAIAGATSRNYIVGEDLVGKYIYVTVTASKENYETKTVNCLTSLASNTSATVLAKSISSAGISLKVNAEYMLGTSELISVADGNKTLAKGEDYTISYTNLGTSDATVVTVTGLANYTGVLTKTFSGISSKVRKVNTIDPNYQDDAGNYYATLNEAFSNATSGSTITVLKDNTDSSDAIVESGKTFILDTNGKTITKTISRITNNGTLTIQGNGTIETAEYSTNNVITMINNFGQLTIKEATLHNKGTSASHWYVVENKSGTTNVESGMLKSSGTDSKCNARVMFINSGTININGGKLESNCMGIHSYDNTTGTVNISGGEIVVTANPVNLTSDNNDNNQTNLYITGGTLISESANAIKSTSSGKLIIGDSSDKVSTTSPVIQGGTHGIDAQNGFEFYDGILKGKTAGHIGNVVTASGYGIQYGTETIDGETYQTEILTLSNYSDGKSCYATLKEAFEKAESGSTITVLKNVEDNEKAEVSSDKSFVLDLNGKTITVNANGEEHYYFIHNYGNLETKDSKGNGKIELTVSQKESKYNTVIFANWEGNLTVTSGTYDITGTIGYTYTINKLDGTLNVNGGTIIARATGSAFVTGIAVIKGNANITAGTIKAYDETNKQFVYGVVNTASGSANIKITGGDIYGSVEGVTLTDHTAGSAILTSTLEVSGNPTIEGGKYGIEIDGSTGNVQIKSGTIKGGTDGIHQRTGKIKIGDNSDKVSTTSPVIQGGTHGIDAQNGFEFYDGILKGKTQAYTVEPDTIPTGYEICHDTETIDGTEYKTAYLVPIFTISDVGPFTYNGQAHTPSITVTANGKTLNPDTDYDVAYANNVNAGTATITVTGKGNYEGSKATKAFTIAPKTLTISWEDVTTFEYNGEAQAPTATVDSGVTGETINLTVTGSATNVGNYTATAEIASVTGGQGKASNYILRNATKDFAITTRAITVTAKDASKVYDGTALTYADVEAPGYTIGEDGLATGHKETVSRSGSITNVGTTAHVIENVTVKDASGNDVTENYNVTRVNGTLKVTAEGSATLNITLNETGPFTYNGTAHKPGITVKVGNATLEKDTDYTVAYTNNVNAGTATITVTGKGNYEGSINSTTFTIDKKDLTITTKSMSKVYDGSLLKYSDISEPRYTVTGLVSRDTLNVVTTGQILEVGSVNHEVTSYTITAGSENSVGNYNVTIKEGTLTITRANITPTVSMSGYTYGGTVSTPSVSGNLGGGDVKYYYRKDGSTTTSEWTTSITSTTLNAGTYYIYAVVGASKNYNGATTAEKSFEVAKKKVTLTSASASKVYDGTTLTATGVTASDLAEGDTLSATANGSITNVGSVSNTFTYDIVRNGVSVKDNYTVTKVEGTLTITSANIKDRVTVELPDDYDYTYDDTEKEPKPIVKDGDKVLEEGKDYTVDYDNNIDATESGESAKVVVKGSGDYSGEVIETFEITKRKITVKVTDVSKIYDGTPLTSDKYELTSGSVVAGHQLTIEISGSQTEIGSSENTITKLIITKADNTDVTKNYNVTKVNGLLTITGETISGNVTLEGVTEVGSTLIANTIGITPANCDFEYKWYVTEEKSLTGGTLIANENEDVYVVRGSDVGKYIYVEVIASVKGAVSTTFRDITDEVIRKGESGGDIDSGDREVDVDSKDLNSSDITVELPKNFDYIYDDTEKEPKPTVKDGDKVLEEGKDYTVDYDNNVNANEDEDDKSKVVIKGSGDYSGEVIKTFEIEKRKITVKLTDASMVYDGTALTSDDYILVSGELVNGHEMTVKGDGSQTDVGESINSISKVTIVNASGDEVTSNYKVTKESGKLTVTPSGSESFEITLNDAGPFTYNGQAHTPEITVKLGDKTLTKETDYTVAYKNNVNAGTATINVTGEGNYAGSKATKTFKISSKMIAVVWGETTFKYNGELQGPTATVNSGVTGETINLNVTGLARNAGMHTATAEIVSVTGGQGETSNYALSKATQNYEITTRKVTLTSASASKVYDGMVLTAPEVTASAKTETEGIVDVDTLSATANGTITNVGSVKNTFIYDIVRDGISVRNNYEVAEVEGTLTVTTANIKDRITVELPSDFDYMYDDTEKEPKPVVRDGNKILEECKDYTVDYDNNIDANEGEDDKSKVVIKGSGDYSGKVIETFEITKRRITVKVTDVSKDYDGTPLTSDKYSLISGTLVNGHKMTITTSGSQTETGESQNPISSLVIVNANNKDVTSNYSVTEEVGTLEVTQAEIKGSVTIEGNAVIGSTLTANTDAIKPTDCDLTYQWFANETNSTSGGTEISGATNKTYTIENGLTGKYIYVEVTANKANYEEKTFKDITDSSNSTDGKVEPKDISDVTVELPDDFDYTYDDTEKEPKPIVKDGDKVLEEGKDYTIDYDDNVDANEGEDDKSKVVIKGSGDYSGEVIETFEITKRKISVKLTDVSKVYDGTPLTSNAHSITSGNLVTGHTMSVTGNGSQTNVGESINSISKVTIVNANGKDVTSNYKVTEEAGILVVTNAEIKGSVTIEGKAVIGSTLTANTDAIAPADCNLTYRWFYNETNSTSGGTEISGATNKTYTIGSGLTGKYIYVEVTASRTNYEEKTFKDITDSSNSTDGKVEPKDISGVTVELPKDFDYTYDDTEKEPKPTVKDGDKVLKEGTDYTVDYKDNVDANEDKADKSKVVIKGTGDYEGEVIETFEITKRKITVKPLDVEKDYDGTELTTSQYVLVSGNLVNGHKLTITTSGSQTEIGSSDNEITSVTIVNASGNNVKPNYNITIEKGTLTVNGVYIEGGVEITGVTRVGKLLVANVINVTPAGCEFTYKWYVSDANSMENGTLIEGENEIGYIVRESDLGKYIYVEVTATRSSSPAKVFKDITDDVIAPKGTTGEVDSGDREVDVIPSISGEVTITGDNIYGSTLTADTSKIMPNDCDFTYQWYYSENGDGTGLQEIVGATNKTYVVGDNTEESLIGKYIYVKVHAEKKDYASADFIDVTDAENNKFDKVEEKDLNSPDVTITLEKDEFTYDGAEHRPNVEIKHNGKTLEEGKDYDVTYKKNIDAGSGEVEIVGKGNYEGTVIKVITIKPMEINVPWGSVTEFVYNGKPQAPSVGTAQGAKDETIYFERTTEVDAGKYTSEASIEKVVGGRENVNNYILVNDTKDYEITRAEAKLTLSSYNVKVVEGNKVKVTYEYIGDGAISYTEIDRNIATFEVKGEEITITGVKEGTTTLKLTALGKNYTDVTATINIKVLSANYTVTNGKDSTNYEKLQDAIDSAESGDTIIVNKDVTEPNGATIDKDITIDLKDKTITTEEPIIVKPNADVTIIADTNDNDETGTIKNPDGTAIDNEGTVNIGNESGDHGPIIDGKDVAIDSEDGDFNFNDGKLIGDDNPPYKGEPDVPKGKYIVTEEENGRYVSKLEVDTVPPVISLYEDKDIVMGPSDKVGLLVDIFEAGSGLDISEFSEGDLIYEVNGERVYPTYERITFTKLINENTYRYYLEFGGITKSGSLTIRIDKDMVFDKAGLGNEATILTEGKIVIDITPPDLSNAELVLIKPENGVTNDGEYEAKISGVTDDNGIGEYQWEIRKDGEDEWDIIKTDGANNSTSYVSGAVEDEGTYYIRVKVSDLIGNSTYSNTISFVYEEVANYNAKPTIKFTKKVVEESGVVTSVKIHTIIKSTTNIVSIKVNGVEISNLNNVLNNAVVEGKFQIRTEFDYEAYANTIYKFEVKDANGNVSTEICNVSDFNRNSAKVTYEIIDASVYGNAKIVFMSNEPIKVKGELPNGFSINRSEANKYSTTIVVDVAEHIKEIDHDFKFANTVEVETNVHVKASIETVARRILTISNKRVLVKDVYGTIDTAKANELVGKMKNAKYMNGNKVDSFYGTNSYSVDFKVTSDNALDAVKTLGGATNIQITKTKGNVVELDASTAIISSATSGIEGSANANMTGVYDLNSSDSFHVTIINK